MIPESATSLGPLGTQGAQNPTGRDAFQELDMQNFIKLLITELSTQDPMEPMNNAQILEQIGQIREIAASDKLTESLDAIMLGKEVSQAAAMIGKWVATDLEGENPVAGRVDRVGIEDGVQKVYIDNRPLPMDHIAHVMPEELGDQLAEALDYVGREIMVKDNDALKAGQPADGIAWSASFHEDTVRVRYGPSEENSYATDLENIAGLVADFEAGIIDRDGNPVNE